MTYSFVARRKEVDKKHKNFEKEAIEKENGILQEMIGKKVKMFIYVNEPIIKCGIGGGTGGGTSIQDRVGILKGVNKKSLRIKLDPEIERVFGPPESFEKEKIQRIVEL
ncbi:MAG: hypothetical protein WC499_04700 [Patescibacteria group bacterium]